MGQFVEGLFPTHARGQPLVAIARRPAVCKGCNSPLEVAAPALARGLEPERLNCAPAHLMPSEVVEVTLEFASGAYIPGEAVEIDLFFTVRATTALLDLPMRCMESGS